MPPFQTNGRYGRYTPSHHPQMLNPTTSTSDDDDDEPLDLDPLPPINSAQINNLRRKKVNPYIKLLARFPYVVTVFSLMFALCAIAFKAKGFPDFSDPTAGFEGRGTEISGSIRTLRLMSNKLNRYPNVTLALRGMGINDTSPAAFIFGSQGTPNYRHKRALMAPPSDPRQDCIQRYIDASRIKMVFASKNGDNLFSARMLRAMCDLEDKLVTTEMESQTECRMHSLPFYVATLNNKCCHEIREIDVNRTRDLLEECAPGFHNGTLGCIMGKGTNNCPQIKQECYQSNAVYKILQYLTDVGFYGKDSFVAEKQGYLTYAMLVFVNSLPEETLSYFHREIEGKDLSNDLVNVVAFYEAPNEKFDLFDDYLMSDLVYFGLAMALILVILMIYLLSFSLMIATVINVGLSFLTSYFVYKMVLGINFFPFMNLLGGLILIAIGADDVFIFYDTWRQVTISDPGLPMELVVDKTFKHAALSIFVTSLTTSAAFFANYVSSIAAIRCFGLFSGIAVLANFFFMVTWTPSVVVLTEKITRCLFKTSQVESIWVRANKRIKNMWEKAYSWFHRYLIAKAWFVWVVVYLALGVGGMVVVFYKPQLQLPHSKEFQLFPSKHPMEFFDQNLRSQFQYIVDEASGEASEIRIYFAWGAHSEDNGDRLDPNDDGHLRLDESFNLTDTKSQLWINGFCNNLKNQTFVDDEFKKSMVCPMDNIHIIIKAYCRSKDIQNYIPLCCKGTAVAPYAPDRMEKCLPLYLALYKKTAHAVDMTGVLFDDEGTRPLGFFLYVKVKEHFTTSFEVMDNLYNEINDYMQEKQKSAPPGLKTSFFTGRGEFEFYDLQKAISHGTYYSIVLSLSVAFVVMLFTSLNVLITLYAIITIALAIAVTVGCLVLLGWELNILESVTISLAVGLSIDFTIHYGVAYRLSKAKDRQSRVHESFVRVGPAVAMAALTTFVAGATMMPCHVLAYTKLGIFLMLVMTFSWLYATFFFQSVCHCIGPKGKFCQIPLPCGRKQENEDPDSYEDGVDHLDMDPDNYDEVDELLLT